MKIKISEEYTDTPGARYESQGPFSGAKFRDEILYPKFIAWLKCDEEFIVDLDGGYGYGSSFLEETFGGLVRRLRRENSKDIDKVINIKIISNDNKMWVDKIAKYIKDAEKAPMEKE